MIFLQLHVEQFQEFLLQSRYLEFALQKLLAVCETISEPCNAMSPVQRRVAAWFILTIRCFSFYQLINSGLGDCEIA